MSTPDPQDSSSPLYTVVDTNPASSDPPNNPDSSQSRFTERQLTPTSVTSAKPIVVTASSHGMSNGQAVRATKFIKLPIASATGMEQLNNRLFRAQNVTANTFELFDEFGNPIDGSNYTSYVSGGQFTITGKDILCVNPSTFPT